MSMKHGGACSYIFRGCRVSARESCLSILDITYYAVCFSDMIGQIRMNRCRGSPMHREWLASV